MDFGGFDMMKAEKMKPMKNFKPKNKAKKFLRYVIVAASAVLLSWSSVWIPIFVQTTTLYIRLACTVVASQKFIFFMCNVIILTLAAKSGQLSGGGGSGSPDLYEEFIKNAENRPKYVTNPEPVEEEVEEKCVSDELAIVPTPEDEKSMVEVEEETKEVVLAEVTSSIRGRYERSQSEHLDRARTRRVRRLQRSETTVGNIETQLDNGENSSTNLVESSNESNDDFNKRVEAFLSKQWSRQREEEEAETLLQKSRKSLAMVVQSPGELS